MNRRHMLVAAAAALLVAVVFALWLLRSDGPPPAAPIATAWSPLSKHVVVEVLNGGARRNAGKSAAQVLRGAGLDVQYIGNAPKPLERQAVSRIIVRAGDTTGTGRVRDALGGGSIVDSTDPSRLVDITVVIGPAFTGAAAPAKQ